MVSMWVVEETTCHVILLKRKIILAFDPLYNFCISTDNKNLHASWLLTRWDNSQYVPTVSVVCGVGSAHNSRATSLVGNLKMFPESEGHNSFAVVWMWIKICVESALSRDGFNNGKCHLLTTCRAKPSNIPRLLRSKWPSGVRKNVETLIKSKIHQTMLKI